MGPVMKKMLGAFLEVIEERTDGMIGLLCPDGYLRFFPPAVQVFPEPSQETSAMEPTNSTEQASLPLSNSTADHTPDRALSAEPPAAVQPMGSAEDVAPPPMPMEIPVARGIVMDCWSQPSESDLAQIERVVAHFVQLMRDQGAPLPDNIKLISQCREAAHKRCFVYRFGTRRLHFAARESEDGRLLLVVRCGGGFMDFVEFARRHGGLEEVKLRKQLEASGVVRVNRVLRGSSIKVSQQ